MAQWHTANIDALEGKARREQLHGVSHKAQQLQAWAAEDYGGQLLFI